MLPLRGRTSQPMPAHCTSENEGGGQQDGVHAHSLPGVL